MGGAFFLRFFSASLSSRYFAAKTYMFGKDGEIEFSSSPQSWKASF